MEIGYKSRWWARCNHVYDKFGLLALVNLLWLRNISKEGNGYAWNEVRQNVRKKDFC